MAVPAVAAVVTSKAVDSATDNEGLINQAFKLTILIGLALAVGVGIFLIWRLTGVFAGVFDILDTGIGIIENIVTAPQLAITAIITASPIGRAWQGIKTAF